MPFPYRAPAALLALCVVAAGPAACTRTESPAAVTAPASTSPPAGCLDAGDGMLEATVRGALDANIAWRNDQMQCEGGVRPDGQGLRLTVAGPLAARPAAPANAPQRQLRFIFGIDLHDTASGSAQALPTNLTVIVEGEQQLYATRGDDKCAVESLQRTPLPKSGGHFERIAVRGYCLGPASDLAGETRVLVPTFTFVAVLRSGDAA